MYMKDISSNKASGKTFILMLGTQLFCLHVHSRTVFIGHESGTNQTRIHTDLYDGSQGTAKSFSPLRSCTTHLSETLLAIFPEMEHSEGTKIPQPYQNLTARKSEFYEFLENTQAQKWNHWKRGILHISRQFYCLWARQPCTSVTIWWPVGGGQKPDLDWNEKVIKVASAAQQKPA